MHAGTLLAHGVLPAQRQLGNRDTLYFVIFRFVLSVLFAKAHSGVSRLGEIHASKYSDIPSIVSFI